jgi:hypothetical protein
MGAPSEVRTVKSRLRILMRERESVIELSLTCCPENIVRCLGEILAYERDREVLRREKE